MTSPIPSTRTRDSRNLLRQTSRIPAPLASTAALLVGLLAAGLWLTGCDFVEQVKNPERYSTEVRVKAILESLQRGTHLAEQEIVCLWGKGSRNLCDQTELERFYDGLTRWTRQKKIYDGIQSWEIVEGVQDPSAVDPTFLYHVKINDKNAYLKVHYKGSIEWARSKDMPSGGGG